MKLYWLSLAPVFAVLALGCETTGSQRDSTIYDTHARIIRLEKNLGGSVEKLNETSAELSAQVSANDRDMAQLRSMLDESQMKMAQLEQSFTSLQDTMYRELGLTGPSGRNSFAPQSTSSSRDAIIEPPAAASRPSESITVTPPPVEEVPPVFESGLGSTPPAVLGTAPSLVNEAEASRAYNHAQEAYKAENYTQALAGFNDFLMTYPASEQAVRALFFKASSQQRLGQYIESIESYQTLKSQYPASSWVPIAIYNQAVAHAKLGELDVAKSILNNLIVQYPATPAAEQAKIELEKLQQY